MNNNRVDVPPHEHLAEAWHQSHRGGVKADRMLREVTVSLPPQISHLSPSIPSRVAAQLDAATTEIAALDADHGEHLASLATLLLRTESVASSKIEHVEASLDDYARALHGVRSNASATSMVASTRALGNLVEAVDRERPITLAALLSAHSDLMADDPSEREYAGRIRDMQNWIEGSDYSPRNASYVPPPARLVSDYLADLLTFANRTDLGVLAQAAIAHAQFESIHPFTDGNGRIGRALVNAVLRRRGATRHVAIPVASAIVARRQDYFDALTSYRSGDAGPIIEAFAMGSRIAAHEARTTATRLAALPDEWRVLAGHPRRGSATDRLVASLLTTPLFSAEEAERLVGGATSSVYAGMARLHEAGVIRPLTQRTRNQIWVAGALVDELEDLGARIAARARGA